MALLPLGGDRPARHAEYMDASRIVRFAHRVGHVFSEVNQANKRTTTLMLSYGMPESDRAPDTYDEFLIRSRISVLHEPPARRRGAGRQVK